MSNPKIPTDSRDWESIDIFLFSNGQQYSPPRKYHLQADDLMLWDTTKIFLARSQFGSMHTAIELYTLDGKKIEGPLELKNSAAYVAVEPPDTFTAAGYEKYLIKASRSWEKRQEKLLDLQNKTNEGEIGRYFDCVTTEQIQGLSMITENSTFEPLKLASPQNTHENPKVSRKDSSNEGKTQSRNRKNTANHIKDVTQKKNTICSSQNENNPYKKKNMTIAKSFKSKNNKQQVVSPISSKILPMLNAKDQDIQKGTNTNNNKDAPKYLNKNLQPINDMKMIPNKTNNEKVMLKSIAQNKPSSDLQTLFTQANEDTTAINISKMPRELSRENLLDEAAILNSIKIDESFSQNTEEIKNEKQKLSIKLRIKLEDFLNKQNGENKTLEEKMSLITMLKEEKASQVNIDIILSKDIFALNNNYTVNENEIDCTCDNFNQNGNTSNRLCYHKIASSDILLLSNAISNIITESWNCKPAITKNIDVGIQYSHVFNDTETNSTKEATGIEENLKLHDVNIQKTDPFVTCLDTVSWNEEKDNCILVEKSMTSSKNYQNSYVQTELCNILVQAKGREDGRYTFHLPTLSLLKQYNIH